MYLLINFSVSLLVSLYARVTFPENLTLRKPHKASHWTRIKNGVLEHDIKFCSQQMLSYIFRALFISTSLLNYVFSPVSVYRKSIFPVTGFLMCLVIIAERGRMHHNTMNFISILYYVGPSRFLQIKRMS